MKFQAFTCLFFFAGTLSLSSPCSATVEGHAGIHPFGTYDSRPWDTIELADLALHLSIPLYVHQARGRDAGIAVTLRYDTTVYPNTSPNPWTLDVTTGKSGIVIATHEYGGDCSGVGDDGYYHDQGTYDAYSYSFVDGTGYAHPFGGVSVLTSNCAAGWSTTSLNEYPLDGSGYWLSATGDQASVIDPSGTKYTLSNIYSTTITDSNGNVGYHYATELPQNMGCYTGTYTDDSNVTVTISGGCYRVNQYMQPTSRDPAYIRYTDPSGSQRTIEIDYQMYSLQGANLGFVSSIVYPDGTTRAFTYQPSTCQAGYSSTALASMRVPTGGTIRYALANTPDCSPGANSLTRTDPDGTTTYSETIDASGPSGPTRTTTTVSKPDSSSEVLKFVYSRLLSSGTSQEAKLSLETSHQWKTSAGAVLQARMTCYNNSSGDCTTTAVTLPIAKQTKVTTLDSGQTLKTVEYFNASSLPIEVDEYDYGSSSPARITTTSYASLGNHISDRPAAVIVYDAGLARIAQTTFGYDETDAEAIPALRGHVPVGGSRGNMTSMHVWINTTGATLDTRWQYDQAGRNVTVQDPRGNLTRYGYDAGTCLVSTTPPPPSNGVSKASSGSCDPYAILPRVSTDANGTSTYYYYDSMLRKSEVLVKSSQGTVASDVLYGYSGAALPATTTTTVSVSASASLISSVVQDALGRTASTVDSNHATVATSYDSMGRVRSVTNPYYSTSDATYGVTSFLYDPLGRVTYQCQPDDGGTNTSNCVHASSFKQWSYFGNSITLRDETGRQWQQTRDGLGRLIRVSEDPGHLNYVTNYSYDALGNLTRVDQWGAASNNPKSRVRTFAYDSASRLVRASNPESGAIQYGYTGSGNAACSGDPHLPCSKADARGAITTYGYDELNRITQKQSSSGTYTYAYDAAVIANCGGLSSANAIGRMTMASDNLNAREYFAYNASGLVTRQTNWTPSSPSSGANPVCAQRDWTVKITQLTYPDGRLVTQQFNASGDLASVEDTSLNGLYVGYRYVAVDSYWPDRSPMSMTAGNGLVTTPYRNKRLQLKEMVVSQGTRVVHDRQYCYGSGAVSGSAYAPQSVGDNGNILRILDTLNSGNSQTMVYDALNRIVEFRNASGSMRQSYSIDPWGNLVQSGTLSSGLMFDGAATNRDLTSGYDAAGNLTDYFNGVTTRHFDYDAESRIISVDHGASTYAYDAFGNRIRKSENTNWTEYIYFDGVSIAEKNQQANWIDYIFVNGTRFAEDHQQTVYQPPAGWVQYVSRDQIGSARIFSTTGPVLYSEYYPFGQVAGGGGTHYLFSGKERDDGSGNDYFGARYYSSAMGRFLSPDWSANADPVPYASLEDPQSLNLYAFVRNNPISRIDADGHAQDADGHARQGQAINGYFFDLRAFNSLADVMWQNSLNMMDALREAMKSQKKAQQQALSSVDVLGTSVAISYGNGLSTADEIAASSKISAGATLINANADSLTAAEKKAVEQISSFSVVGPGSYLGATGKGSMTLSAGYIKASSAAWIGSLFGHEGQHYLNAGKFSGANLWRDEQLAGRTQLGIGEKIGFSRSETRYIENWIDDRNKAAMQQHMLQGYSY